MNIKQKYNEWLKCATYDKDLQDELLRIKDDEAQIYERFYKSLEFGTAGLRGIIGAGPNRMNVYTVRKATQGFANSLNEKYTNPKVAISYDSRIKSEFFAREAAMVLAANGIQVHITRELEPTPVLSFAVRYFKCSGGIMITASHNPAKYNGYKCYGDDGCQMTDKHAQEVYDEIKVLDEFEDVKVNDFDGAVKSGMISYIGDDFYDEYLKKVEEQQVISDICKKSHLKVVYTPLNGAGNKLVKKVLSDIGVYDVQVVKEQEMPDGRFKTCPYPNPEIKEALDLAIKLAGETKADLVLATDPDSDRVGIAVKYKDEYKLLTGNEVGVLLTNYILSVKYEKGLLCKDPIVVKTVVTTPMIDVIAKDFGCEVRTVLTGFKYIGEQILMLERRNEESRFVFGFEESYGYLAGSYVRDKDAVVASMLICEMASFYESKGISLYEKLQSLYEKYGYYIAKTRSYSFEGAAGMEKMKNIMKQLRDTQLNSISGIDVVRINDYLISESIEILSGDVTKIDLPKSNVLLYELSNGSIVIVRPSGTEPKMKIYVTACDESNELSEKSLQKIFNVMEEFVK